VDDRGAKFEARDRESLEVTVMQEDLYNAGFLLYSSCVVVLAMLEFYIVITNYYICYLCIIYCYSSLFKRLVRYSTVCYLRWFEAGRH